MTTNTTNTTTNNETIFNVTPKAAATFPNLVSSVNSYFDGKFYSFSADLEKLTCREALNSWYYRNAMTAAALRMVQESTPEAPIPAKAAQKMRDRFSRENEKSRRVYLDALNRAADAEDFEFCFVNVDWAKSRTWGKNPTATVTADYNFSASTKNSASGWDTIKKAPLLRTP